jgi:PTH1 family peptidyl-tRNA hydrolase
MQKKWIVGLGNPGKKYEQTRHNAGFLAVKRFADDLGWSLNKEKHQSLYAKGQVDSTQLTLILPQTFMNLSGDAVAAWKGREGLDPASDLLVIFDDMDLSFGKLRIRAEGSGGSHNGMASLIERLGTKQFNRLRLGIGKPENPEAWADYVTQKFSAAERGAPLQSMLERAVKGARSWLTHSSFEKLMAEVNG